MGNLDPEGREIVVAAYLAGIPVGAICSAAGITRQTVATLCRKAGVRRVSSVIRDCARCGAPVRRFLSKGADARRVFCTMACYAAHMQDTVYQEDREGSRRARALVRRFFPLADWHVVHHLDGDQANNALTNLGVFASQADHMRWHRGGGDESGAKMLWRGDRAS